MRVVLDLHLAMTAVALQDAPRIGEVEHRLDAARNVAGEQRNGARRRDGGQAAVANAVAGDDRADIRRQSHDARPGQEVIRIVKGKCSLFLGQLSTCEIGGALDVGHPGLGKLQGTRRAIAGASKNQRVGQAGQAKTDTPLGLGLLALGFERVVGHVDDGVEHAHGNADAFFQLGQIDIGAGFERMIHQPRQIDRPEQTGTIGRQWLFAARIGGVNVLAIGEVVLVVDAVDEDDARLGELVGRAHDALPQIARLERAHDAAGEDEIPILILADGADEGIGDQH